MRDRSNGEQVRIYVGEEPGPYAILPAAQAGRVHETFVQHRVPHRLYPTASNALCIVYLLSTTIVEYAQALLDAIP